MITDILIPPQLKRDPANPLPPRRQIFQHRRADLGVGFAASPVSRSPAAPSGAPPSQVPE